MLVAAVVFGFLIGLTLGLLGGGGSILTVPIFVYVLGFDAKASIAMGLAVVGATSLVGALGHWRDGRVNLRVALIFAAVAAVGTSFGTRFSTRLTGDQQLAIFAVVMLAAAAVMLRGRNRETATRARSRATLAMVTAAQGLVVGALTGLVGIGGGFLIVPALLWGGLPMCDAVGTSLLVIAINCAIGFYGHAAHVEIVWSAVLLLTAGTLPGIAAGTYAIRYVSQQALRRGFALLIVGVAIYMLSQNLGLVSRG